MALGAGDIKLQQLRQEEKIRLKDRVQGIQTSPSDVPFRQRVKGRTGLFAQEQKNLDDHLARVANPFTVLGDAGLPASLQFLAAGGAGITPAQQNAARRLITRFERRGNYLRNTLTQSQGAFDSQLNGIAPEGGARKPLESERAQVMQKFNEQKSSLEGQVSRAERYVTDYYAGGDLLEGRTVEDDLREVFPGTAADKDGRLQRFKRAEQEALRNFYQQRVQFTVQARDGLQQNYLDALSSNTSFSLKQKLVADQPIDLGLAHAAALVMPKAEFEALMDAKIEELTELDYKGRFFWASKIEIRRDGDHPTVHCSASQITVKSAEQIFLFLLAANRDKKTAHFTVDQNSSGGRNAAKILIAVGARYGIKVTTTADEHPSLKSFRTALHAKQNKENKRIEAGRLREVDRENRQGRNDAALYNRTIELGNDLITLSARIDALTTRIEQKVNAGDPAADFVPLMEELVAGQESLYNLYQIAAIDHQSYMRELRRRFNNPQITDAQRAQLSLTLDNEIKKEQGAHATVHNAVGAVDALVRRVAGAAAPPVPHATVTAHGADITDMRNALVYHNANRLTPLSNTVTTEHQEHIRLGRI